MTKKRCSGLAILLGDDYTNQRDINTEGDSEDSDPVLIEVESYMKERPLNREEKGGKKTITDFL